MSIRICGGTYRSIRLHCPDAHVRPTTDRVKEAIFSTLLHHLDGARVLDLFAGSGALGCEAISRGARRVTFVDQSRECVGFIRRNVEIIHAEAQAVIVRSDARTYVVSCRDTFDLIFMDPPYHKGLASDLAPHVYTLLDKGGILVVEHESGEEINLAPWKQKRYGDTSISYYLKD